VFQLRRRLQGIGFKKMFLGYRWIAATTARSYQKLLPPMMVWRVRWFFPVGAPSWARIRPQADSGLVPVRSHSPAGAGSYQPRNLSTCAGTTMPSSPLPFKGRDRVGMGFRWISNARLGTPSPSRPPP
jgi:hypothetical protein